MTEDTVRRPQPITRPAPVVEQEFHVSELVSDSAGAHSPFGDLEFPLPIEQLTYTHPGPADRPNLAGH